MRELKKKYSVFLVDLNDLFYNKYMLRLKAKILLIKNFNLFIWNY